MDAEVVKNEKKMRKIILRCLKYVPVFILALIILLYMPFVQDIIVGMVLKSVNKSSDVEIHAEKVRLYFPVDVEAEGVTILEQSGDTMLSVGKTTADIGFWSLMMGNVVVEDVDITDVHYQMGTLDSVLYMNVVANKATLKDATLKLSQNDINVEGMKLQGAIVNIVLKDTITTEENDTAKSVPWTISTGMLEIEDIAYTMSMLPIIDSLGAYIDNAKILDAIVDLSQQNITAQMLCANNLNATYIYPLQPEVNDEILLEKSNTSIDTLENQWKIVVDSIRISATNAIYAQRGACPREGLDMNYLQAENVDIAIDSFYNEGINIKSIIKNMSATEHCGISIGLEGRFDMDNRGLCASSMKLKTMYSAGEFDFCYPLLPNEPINLNGIIKLNKQDIALLYPIYKSMLVSMPEDNISIDADISGSLEQLNIENLLMDIENSTYISMSGYVDDVMNYKNMSGNIVINGNITDVDYLKPMMLGDSSMVNIPKLSIDGDVNIAQGDVSGILSAMTDGGRLAFDATLISDSLGYKADMHLDTFPINAFVPELGLGKASGRFTVDGKGFDIVANEFEADVDIKLDCIEYLGKGYQDISAWFNMKNHKVDGGLVSLNDAVDLDIVIDGNISDSLYVLNFIGDIRNMDLKSMGLSIEEMRGLVSFNANVSSVPQKNNIEIDMNVDDVDWTMSSMPIVGRDVNIHYVGNDSLTKINLRNYDMSADFTAYNSIDSLSPKLMSAIEILDKQIRGRQLDFTQIQQDLPKFELELNAGSKNILSNILSSNEISYEKLNVEANNSTSLEVRGFLDKLKIGETRLDKMTFVMLQNGRVMIYNVATDNKRGTIDEYAHVNMFGFVGSNKMSSYVKHRNIDDSVGFDVGAMATFSDSIVSISVMPQNPIIGYKRWTINDDNIMEYNMYTRLFDANFNMRSGNSMISLNTEHENAENHQEDVILKMANLNLSEWLKASPFLPPIKGVVSADMRFRWGEETFSGDGNVAVENLYYGRERVGTFNLDVDLNTNSSGQLNASAAMMVDGVKTMTLNGALNDTTATSPFDLDFTMIHFPLKVVNPFLPKGTAKLSGMLNGKMDVTGDAEKPMLNGYIEFDSASVKIDMIGSSFRFTNEKVPVINSVIKFDKYKILGSNNNALNIDGKIDIGDYATKIDIETTARDMQIISSERGKGTDVYGRAFINLDASIKGDLSKLDVGATISLLSGSNVTYVMTDAVSSLSSQNVGDMVRFVQFDDTTHIEESDTLESVEMAMNLDVKLRIAEGTTLNVDLSANGSDKVQVLGSGSFNYTMSYMGDSRFTGRYNINSGFVRYTPPLMGEKKFDFQEGSFIAFNGDMMNPTLNLKAKDELRANVTQDGQDSRIVPFDVAISVTNTLSNMDIAFDLSTSGDVTIANELQTMSAEQRANQAMNMLLYNVYTGPGTRGDASMMGNPLYAFLESQVNSWAANNIKFVDISFGIDQYDKTTGGTTSSTTNYSYRVSKTLFNDRFKIVVGGNYSTDAESDEDIAQNLVNNISFEYMLNRSGSMYVKIFRHTDYESILEGEITQTGVGFVYKRKINSLKDLFRFGRRPKQVEIVQEK